MASASWSDGVALRVAAEAGQEDCWTGAAREAWTSDGWPAGARACVGASARVEISDGTSLYGTGMAAGGLLRNGRVTDCGNHDACDYGQDTPNLYQSHPWVLAVRPDGCAFGVLAESSQRLRIDLQRGILFTAQAGRGFPVIVIDRSRPRDVVAALAELTLTSATTTCTACRWARGRQAVRRCR